MIKCEVNEQFSLKDFDKLSNLKRATGKDKKGELYPKDTFECDEEMANYLLGDNPLKKQVVNLVEIQPEKKEKPKIVVKEVAIEMPKEKSKKKKSKK